MNSTILQELGGKVCTIVNVANDLALSVNGYNLGRNGSGVLSWPLNPNGNTFQDWRFKPFHDGFHIVSNSPQTRESNYLELSSHEIGVNGGTVQLWDNRNPDHLNKIWILHKNNDGSYSMATVSRDKYVMEIASEDVPKHAAGKIQMWENEGNSNQKWRITPR